MPWPLVLIARTVRTVVLVGVLVVIRVTEGLFRHRSPAFGPRLLRRQLESAGAGFAKIGQLLAHRHDVLPDRYCTELAKILDDMPVVPWPLIHARLLRDLRIGSLTEIFAQFDERPMSAASIAQVHHAVLLNGTPVVVKVMRPGIETRFQVDLLLAGALARLGSALFSLRRLGLRALAAELDQLTREELDFMREVRNFRQMRQRMASDDIDHYCPAVYPEYSARTIITMEEIRGVSVKSLMLTAVLARQGTSVDAPSTSSVRDEAVAQLARWADEGITPERTARVMVRSFLEQAMHHRLFHADPHAANLIVMRGGTLAWIDLGMLGWLDERLWTNEFKLREAIANGRLDAAYGHLLASMEPLPAGDLSAFEAEFKRILHDWLAEVEQPTPPTSVGGVSQRSNFHLFTQTLGAIRRAGLRLPVPLVRLYRTIIIGDMVVLQLDPTVNWQELIRDFVVDERLRETVQLCERGPSLHSARAAIELVVDGPALLVGALRRLDEASESPRVRARDVSRSERAIRRLIGQLKLAVAVGALVLFFMPWVPSDWVPAAMGTRIGAVGAWRWGILLGSALTLWMLSQVQAEFED